METNSCYVAVFNVVASGGFVATIGTGSSSTDSVNGFHTGPNSFTINMNANSPSACDISVE